jgi:hypothetical protein
VPTGQGQVAFIPGTEKMGTQLMSKSFADVGPLTVPTGQGQAWSDSAMPEINKQVGNTIQIGDDSFKIDGVMQNDNSSNARAGFKVTQVDASGNDIVTGNLYLDNQMDANGTPTFAWRWGPSGGTNTVLEVLSRPA